MWLFWYAKDFRRKISMNSFSRWANNLNAFIIFRKLRKQFFNQKIIFRIINKNRILIVESIPLMRNPPGTRIVTMYPNSHTYSNSHRFLVSRKCDYLEALQYAFYDFIIHKLLLNLFNHNNSICIFMTESAIYCE